MIDNIDIINKLEKRLMSFKDDIGVQNIGSVIRNTDGVIEASGLSKTFMGEVVFFEDGSPGMVLNLNEDTVSILALENADKIKEESIVKTSGRMLEVETSEQLLGRAINPLGQPLTGETKIKSGKNMALERIAPGVVKRKPVNTPLKTGIKAIDSMIPIGRGQRELIIGDRQTGKTAIAIDTIINQRPKNNKQKQVICIYVAIGQKQSSVAQVIDKLKSSDSLNYSIVVSGNASDPVSLQYLAPYTGCAIAEYFMEKGKDVLIVYDDLTKHAWAYRQISLVLRRPAGREAYPGDIFYLHSRLLERAAKLSQEHGGGSITALPIIETQANDISSYIPTNVISITDGQIYLETSLFNSGIRPAINIGNSVSRVGGAAQTATMKSVSGKLRLELAQYRELAAFAQFGSELDKETQKQIERGKRLVEVLKQPQYQPLSEEFEFLSINAVISGFMDDVPIDNFKSFESQYHAFIKRAYPQILKKLSTGEKPTDPTLKEIEKATAEFKKNYFV